MGALFLFAGALGVAIQTLMEIPPSVAPVVLAIFVLTYLGVALGHVPGLKLNRTGIALLGAIAIAVFSGLSTTSVVGLVNWPTILLLFGFFCPVGATAALRFFRPRGQRDCRPAR